MLGLCLAGPGSADPPALRIERHGDGPLRLLWIGNSHTARHAIAAQVAAMAPGAVSITVVTMNGAAVAETLARDAAARLFARPEWDVVVLQDWSWHAMRRPDALHATLETIGPARPEQRILLYQNWAYSSANRFYELAPETPAIMQARIDALFLAMPERYGVSVAPVGRAIWRGQRLGLVLISEDGNHLTPLGASVAAVAIHRALFQAAPAGFRAVLLRPLTEPPWLP